MPSVVYFVQPHHILCQLPQEKARVGRCAILKEMQSTDLITSGEFPKPAPRKRGRPKKQTMKEKRGLGLEAAAIAYVQMENADYKYAEGTRKQSGDHPTLYNGINKRELMRRAGYAPGSLDHFDDYMATSDAFWELVELHRLRRTDPMFRREQEGRLWQAIGGEALRNLYERLFYYPHSMSTEQHLKIVKLILDAGITLQKLGGEKPNKTAGLLDSLQPEQRASALKGFEETLIEELEQVQALKKAHNAADRESRD